jgi:hypothetical protein
MGRRSHRARPVAVRSPGPGRRPSGARRPVAFAVREPGRRRPRSVAGGGTRLRRVLLRWQAPQPCPAHRAAGLTRSGSGAVTYVNPYGIPCASDGVPHPSPRTLIGPAQCPFGGMERALGKVRFARLIHSGPRDLGGPAVRAADGGNLRLPWLPHGERCLDEVRAPASQFPHRMAQPSRPLARSRASSRRGHSAVSGAWCDSHQAMMDCHPAAASSNRPRRSSSNALL